MTQPQPTHRDRTINKASQLLGALENLEDLLSAAVAGAENLQESMQLTDGPTWPEYDPAVYQQLRDTVRLLHQRTQDPCLRLDLDRIDRVLAAVTDS